MGMKEWRVTVYTGKCNDAGTDADISIYMVGPKGETAEANLDNDADNFEINSLDEFTITLKDVGTPERLVVRNSNSGNKPGWFLNKIRMNDLETGNVYTFPCDNWLSVDTHLTRTLYPE